MEILSWKLSKKIYLIIYPISAISFIIFWDFLMFRQTFFSPQVKRWAIVTYKHGLYELPHELPNNLRLRILENQKKSGKCPNFIEENTSAQTPYQNENFVNNSRELLKNKLNFCACPLFHIKTRISLKYFVSYCLWKHFFYSNSPQIPLNLFFLTFWVTPSFPYTTSEAMGNYYL